VLRVLRGAPATLLPASLNNDVSGHGDACTGLGAPEETEEETLGGTVRKEKSSRIEDAASFFYRSVSSAEHQG